MPDVTQPKYTFHAITKKVAAFESKDVKQALEKWCMNDTMRITSFCYDQFFPKYDAKDFILDFFNNPEVLSTFQTLNKSGRWSQIIGKTTEVNYEEVPCTVLSMSFFDKLVPQVVRESGSIVKCFDEYYGDITVSDELRKMMMSEESDFCDIFTEAEKKEFVYRIMQHLTIGGAVCQYEDDFKPYSDTVKNIYKDLVSVQKDPQTKELVVNTYIFKISGIDNECGLFDTDPDHVQNFCYLLVDPTRRHVSVWYNAWLGA
eukprot:Colp12_sorted_trinity150504_noHs@19930